MVLQSKKCNLEPELNCEFDFANFSWAPGKHIHTVIIFTYTCGGSNIINNIIIIVSNIANGLLLKVSVHLAGAVTYELLIQFFFDAYTKRIG